MLCQGLILLPQFGQADGGVTIDFPLRYPVDADVQEAPDDEPNYKNIDIDEIGEKFHLSFLFPKRYLLDLQFY